MWIGLAARLGALLLCLAGVEAQTLSPSDVRLRAHRAGLWAESRERFEQAQSAAGSSDLSPLPPSLVVAAGRELAALRRLTLQLEGQAEDPSAAWGSALDLMAVPGLAEAGLEQGPVIALRVWCPHQVPADPLPLRVEAFWTAPGGTRQKLRSEAVAPSAFESPGFDLFFRAPETSAGQHRIEVEIDFDGQVRRACSAPIVFECVERLGARLEALESSGSAIDQGWLEELRSLERFGQRPAHGLSIEALLQAAEAQRAWSSAQAAPGPSEPAAVAASHAPQPTGEPGVQAPAMPEPHSAAGGLSPADWSAAQGPQGWFRPAFAPRALAYRPRLARGWALLLADQEHASSGRFRGPLGTRWRHWAEAQGLVLVAVESADWPALAASWAAADAPLVLAPGAAGLSALAALRGPGDRSQWRFVLEARGPRPPPVALPGVLLLGREAYAAAQVSGAGGDAAASQVRRLLPAPPTVLETELRLPEMLADWPTASQDATPTPRAAETAEPPR
jgi:hypothetical protein